MRQENKRWLLNISFPSLSIGVYIVAIYLFDDSPKLFLIANTVFTIMIIESLYGGWERFSKISLPRGILLLYSMWIGMSIIWAWDKSATLGDIKRQIIFTILWLSIVNVFKWDENAVKNGFKWIMIAGVCLTCYLLLYYGPAMYIQAVFQGKRIGEEILQLNKLGMYTATSCIVAFNLYIEDKKTKYLFVFIFVLIAMIGSGSKRAFLMLGLSMVISLVLKIKNEDTKNRAIKIFTAIFAVYVIAMIVLKLNFFSGVLGRFQELFTILETGDTKFSRIRFIKYGLKSFRENPIVGLGSGNSHKVTLEAMGWATYLHNNYLEQLVDLGIIGFFLYYGLYAILLKSLFPVARKGSFCARIMIILLLSQLISDMAVTSYNLKLTYILFAIAISIIENSYQRGKSENVR